MLNPAWNRWIYVSLSVHFEEARGSIPFFVEGQIRPTTIYDFAEYRQDGPFYKEVNPDHWHIDVLASVLIQMVQDNNDIHKLERWSGVFASAFERDICCYRYGDEQNDDGGQFGVLSIRPGEYVRVDKFGQTQPAARILQASIECRYRMDLTI